MHRTDVQLFAREIRICGILWIRGVERRGKEAQHMASFSEVKWRLKPAHYLTHGRPGHFVVNITLCCFAFANCYNNMRSCEVIARHPNAFHKTEA